MKWKKRSTYADIIRAVEYLEANRDGISPCELRKDYPRIYAAWVEKALYSECRAW